MKYTTSVPAIYTIGKECVYESHMFGAAPLSSKADTYVRKRMLSRVSQQTVKRKESKDLQT